MTYKVKELINTIFLTFLSKDLEITKCSTLIFTCESCVVSKWIFGFIWLAVGVKDKLSVMNLPVP
jgi:hypothetical protein